MPLKPCPCKGGKKMHVGDCDCKKKMLRMSDVGRPRGEGEPRKMRAMRAMGAS